MGKKREINQIFQGLADTQYVRPINLHKFSNQIANQALLSQQVAQATPEKHDFALYLANHSFGAPKITGQALATAQGASTEKPTLLSNIFSYLDTPRQLVASNIQSLVDNFHKDESVGAHILDFLKGEGQSTLGALERLGSPLPGLSLEHADKVDPKVYGSDILNKDFGFRVNQNSSLGAKIGHGSAGFALDVLLDPTTYVGLGPVADAFKGVAKGAKTLDKGGSEVDKILTTRAATETKGNPAAFKSFNTHKPIQQGIGELSSRPRIRGINPRLEPPRTQIHMPNFRPEIPGIPVAPVEQRILADPVSMDMMKAEQRAVNARRAAYVRWGRNPDVEELARANPKTKAEFVDFMRGAKMAKRGQVVDKHGNISAQAVNKIINDINDGKILQFGKEMPPAEGLAGEVARQQMDELIKNIKSGKRTDFNPANQANAYNRAFATTERIFRADPELVAKYGVKAGKKGEKVVPINSPRVLAARRIMAQQMVRTMEDHAISLGHQPVYWNGMRLRLSDILAEVGFPANEELTTRVMDAFVTKDLSKIHEPVVEEAIATAIARRSNVNADVIQNLGTTAQTYRDNLLVNYPKPQAEQIAKRIPEQMKQAALATGMTEEEANAVRDYGQNIINASKTPADQIVESLGPALVKAVRENKVDIKAIQKKNAAISRMIGESGERAATDITGFAAIDGVMANMATWYGRFPEMKRYSQDVFLWGERNAQLRAQWFREKAKQYTEEEIRGAFRMAQGILPYEGRSLREQTLARQFQNYFETMLGSSGFKDLHDSEGTVAARSNLIMADINKHLKAVHSKFRFTDSKTAKNVIGVPRDYSDEGAGWMLSWENASPATLETDPVRFMYDLDLAMERVTKEYALFDEFARRFGARKTDTWFNPRQHTSEIGHDRLQGYYFDPQQASQFKKLIMDNEEGLWSPQSKAMQFYARGLRAWKSAVTIYYPSHHIRNFIGDSWLMWSAGHSDPRAFIKSFKVIGAQRARYAAALKAPDLNALSQITDRDALEFANARTTDVITKLRGQQITAEQYYLAAHQHGLLLDANLIEDLFGQAPLENIGIARKVLGERGQRRFERPLGGHAHHIAATVAEVREHSVRMAHFIAAVEKGIKKSKGNVNLTKIYEDAAHEVRKWHPDGRDMTRFEQKYLRTVIPFYSWARKSVPLVIQTAVTRPSKVLAIPRATYSIQEIAGIKTPDPLADPFPNNQLFPDWIRSYGVGPIGDPESDNEVARFFGMLNMPGVGSIVSNAKNPITGNPMGYVLVAPGDPFSQDIQQYLGSGKPSDIFRGIIDSLTPAAKIPIDLGTNQTFSGAPIFDSADGPGIGLPAYLVQQIPGLTAVANVKNIGQSQKTSNTSPTFDKQAIFNYLTAANVRGTGPYIKSAEFEAKTRAQLAKAKRNG